MIFLRLPLILSEGVGDSLYQLSLFPHKKWSRWGIGFNLFYQAGSSHSGNYRRSLCELIHEIPYFRYLDRPPTLREKKLDNRLKRYFSLSTYWRFDVAQKSRAHQYLDRLKYRLGVRPYYPVSFSSHADDVQFDSDQIHLAFHTHQDGVPFKQWGVDRWCELFNAIERELGDTIQIWVLEYNHEVRAYFRIRFPKIQFLNELYQEFPSQCRLLQKMDLVVGIDSWFKFITAWSGTKTLVVVPSHEGGGYWGDPTADQLSRSVYDGLLDCPSFTVIGIEEIAQGRFKYSIPVLSQLDPSFIFEKIKNIINHRFTTFHDRALLTPGLSAHFPPTRDRSHNDPTPERPPS